MFCKTCQTDKPADGFYTSNRTKCKDCVKSSVKLHRQENLEKVRSYDRMRGSMPHRVAARAAYAKTNAYKQSSSAAARRWAASHPERRRAQIAIGNAVRDGRIFPQPCWCCGEKAEAHHPDYSRPLDVVWLCSQHHRDAHSLVKEYQ